MPICIVVKTTQSSFRRIKKAGLTFSLQHIGTVFVDIRRAGKDRIANTRTAFFIATSTVVRWVYDWKPEPGSAEEKLYTNFLKSREWV